MKKRGLKGRGWVEMISKRDLLRYDDRFRRVCPAEFLKLIGIVDFGKLFGPFAALIAESALTADNWNWFLDERELGKSRLFLGGCFLGYFGLMSEQSLTE